MKWGYVIYYFRHLYINYHILCNEKAEKKPSWTTATLFPLVLILTGLYSYTGVIFLHTCHLLENATHTSRYALTITKSLLFILFFMVVF